MTFTIKGWRRPSLFATIKLMTKGKFIVFEGLDNSGKSTQTKMLLERLRKEGIKVSKIDFPRHGEPGAWLVDNYLVGKYGSAKEIGPYVPSIFYACDRFDASMDIRKRLKSGQLVICDRYVASNIGHQGGKISDKKKREKYLTWLHELEYDVFKIPKPDITVILKNSPELSMKLSKKKGGDAEKRARKKSYLRGQKSDIHENDLTHLKQTIDSYLWVAKKFPKEYKIIECIKSGKMLTPDEVHKKIWEEVKNKI
ncbi:hypothetical protein A3J77_01680 [Candidatus Wolfebacteria bacterium RBG_13_41_7]|uniref:Thymidylate kinase n=1 Tax=Candidatus Wolfebacteria bacterium RBG_13_41_7 TaxID=1802554 RepID=A0A1F8DM58_9BACT|nr:MAG: hypothetical protein A3J77_01680 [Candidatus Wolfebacteria bacterium RBG_13_41_7]